MPLNAGDKLGPYEITGLLGRGGMGEVYRAHDSRLHRDVAIKVSGEQFSDRFQREAYAVAALNHPNICTLFDVGPNYLVMELVDGPTLSDRIKEGAVPLEEALGVAKQIGDALEAAHDKGIVHRDLKPANVKLRPDGLVKVLDFGLAKRTEPQSSAASEESPTVTMEAATRLGVIMGSAGYMAPEQARGKTVDKRADIFGYGVVLHEMLTGQRLFTGDTVSDSLASVLKHEPDLDMVPPKVRRLLRRCLEKDPQKRLRDIGDAAILLEESPVEVRNRRSRLWPVLAAGLMIATAVTTWLLMRKADDVFPVTRFYVDAPPGTAFNYTYTGSAISPDGSMLAFRIADGKNPPSLWLRPLNALAARPLPGTYGGDFPFWSPDSKAVGFFAGGKLKRVEVDGGAPLTICDASDADTGTTGGTWSRDNVIVFGGKDGLRRVPAAGGAPAHLTQVNAPRRETGHGFPQFLPDGKHLIFFIRSEDKKAQGMYATPLERPQDAKLILATDRKAIFAAGGAAGDGHLLHLRDQTLMAQPFNPESLKLEGEPAPLADEVALFPPGFHASFWASDTGVLIYRTGASDSPKLTWMSRQGKNLSEVGAEDFYTYVRISPDGNQAAVEMADSSGNADIWTWDFGRGGKTRRTFAQTADRYPVWSSDGSEIAFSSTRTGIYQIYRKSANGVGEEQQLTDGVNSKFVSDWSRDGKYLLFDESASATGPDIWALPLEGDRKPFAIVNSVFIESSATLSPDGKWIAFESTEAGRPEIFVQPFRPAENQPEGKAVDRWQVSSQGGSRPKWKGDSKELFFISLGGNMIMSATIRTTGKGIESGNPQALFQIPVMPETRSPYDVTADGQKFLILERTISQAVPLVVVMNWRAGSRR